MAGIQEQIYNDLGHKKAANSKIQNPAR